MKIIKYIFLFICVNVFAQKTYEFDYYTVYEFKSNVQDTVVSKTITLANSNNSNYFVHICIDTNNIAKVYFYDLEINNNYTFSSKGIVNENTDFRSLFTNPVPFNFDLKSLRKKSVDKYDVIYNGNEIIVRRFKNSRKKKIISDYHILTEPSNIAKNQIFTSNLVFAYKFDISKITSENIIKESYVIIYSDKEENRKENIRTLKDIQSIDFKLDLPVTDNTIKIPKIKIQQ